MPEKGDGTSWGTGESDSWSLEGLAAQHDLPSIIARHRGSVGQGCSRSEQWQPSQQ